MNAHQQLMALPEVYVQKLVRQLFSTPGRRWQTTNGQQIEILASGEWNFDAGPDFCEAAIVSNGEVLCGDIEFHLQSSDWRRHGHQRDLRYDNVLVHAVLENDDPQEYAQYTLILPAEELHVLWQNDLRRRKSVSPQDGEVIASLQVIQDYAVRRLERKISYARELIHMFDVPTALMRMLRIFLDSFARGKRRPAAGAISEDQWKQALADSPIIKMLQLLQEGRLRENVADCFDRLTMTRIMEEGPAFRFEVLINVVLPLALQLVNATQREQLLNWFWAQRATQNYGRLSRIFGHLPQETVWQQQGMLEYFHEIRNGRQRVCDLMFRYNAGARHESALLSYSGEYRRRSASFCSRAMVA